MVKNRKIEVKGTLITVSEKNNDDYISLTDMVSGFEEGSSLIESWMRNKNTIEFLAVWEKLHNPDFNDEGYKKILSDVGTNRFVMSAKKWSLITNGIGLYANAGRYGGTYARIEIVFEFCTWLNPFFKILSIKQNLSYNQDYNTIFANFFTSQSMPASEKCHLYLMQDLSTMLYKIGISKSPNYREKTLQSEKPSINMICCKEFQDKKTAYLLEQSIHKKFHNSRIRGEWFNFSSEDLIKIEYYFLAEY